MKCLTTKCPRKRAPNRAQCEKCLEWNRVSARRTYQKRFGARQAAKRVKRDEYIIAQVRGELNGYWTKDVEWFVKRNVDVFKDPRDNVLDFLSVPYETHTI